jgi:hypothetical protein
VMPMIVADKLTLLDLNSPSAPSRDFRLSSSATARSGRNRSAMAR